MRLCREKDLGDGIIFPGRHTGIRGTTLGDSDSKFLFRHGHESSLVGGAEQLGGGGKAGSLKGRDLSPAGILKGYCAIVQSGEVFKARRRIRNILRKTKLYRKGWTSAVTISRKTLL